MNQVSSSTHMWDKGTHAHNYTLGTRRCGLNLLEKTVIKTFFPHKNKCDEKAKGMKAQVQCIVLTNLTLWKIRLNPVNGKANSFIPHNNKCDRKEHGKKCQGKLHCCVVKSEQTFVSVFSGIRKQGARLPKGQAEANNPPNYEKQTC